MLVLASPESFQSYVPLYLGKLAPKTVIIGRPSGPEVYNDHVHIIHIIIIASHEDFRFSIESFNECKSDTIEAPQWNGPMSRWTCEHLSLRKMGHCFPSRLY